MLIKHRFIVIIISYLLIIAVSGLISAYSVDRSMASPVIITGEEGLSVSPDDARLFEIENMYPGREDTTEVVVENEGDEYFALSLDLDFEGDQVMAEALEVVISSGDDEYYKGAAGEIEEQEEILFVEPEGKETLYFTLELQTGFGNRTQGKSADFTWTFAADAEESEADIVEPVAPADPDPDPFEPLVDPDPVAEADPLEALVDEPGEPAEEVVVTPEEPDVVMVEEPDVEPFEPAVPAEEVVEPEVPEVTPLEDEVAAAFNYWLLLLLLIPLLLLFLLACQVVVMVPDSRGNFKVVARRIARRKNGKWHANIEKQLDRHLARQAYVVTDFRGWMIRRSEKELYSGTKVIGTSMLRYATIGRGRLASWSDALQDKESRSAS